MTVLVRLLHRRTRHLVHLPAQLRQLHRRARRPVHLPAQLPQLLALSPSSGSAAVKGSLVTLGVSHRSSAPPLTVRTSPFFNLILY